MFRIQHSSSSLRLYSILSLIAALLFSFVDGITAQERPAAPANPNQEPVENPFARRISIPDLPTGMQWLNTSKPLTKQDLKGKFVVLDFWTYCCINCLHILPELKKLEQAYPRVPFTWLETSAGDEFVFLLQREQLPNS